MRVVDSAELAGVHETPEGYLEAAARISRTGVQLYTGAELGRPEMKVVRVYRGDDAVFDMNTLNTFANIPLTIEHPKDLVTAENWREHAVGVTGNEVLRDGQYLKIGLRVTDAAAVAAIKRGKRELSVGYEAQFDWTPGKTPEGEVYDCRQTSILANHLAITDAARAGSAARIGDSWGAAPIQDHKKEDAMSMKSVVLGDAAVQVATDDVTKVDAFKAQVAKDAAEAQKVADDKVAELEKKLAEKDSEIAELKKKQVSDSDIERLAAERAKLVGDAKTIVADYDAAGKTPEFIRREVVAQSGRYDVNDSTSQAYVDAAFDLLLKTPAQTAAQPDPVRNALMDSKPGTTGDAGGWAKALDSLPNAKKGA